MPSHLTDIRVNRVSIVNRAAVRDATNPTQPQGFLLFKSDNTNPALPGKGVPMPTPTGTDDLQARLEKAEKDRDDALAKAREAEEKLAEASKTKDDGDGEEPTKTGDLIKSELPEAVCAVLEKAEKEAEELRKEAKEAQEIAKAERHARETREFIMKAESEFAHLGKAEDVGPMLMKLRDSLSKEDYEAHTRMLAAASEQIKTGALFKEAGVGGGQRPQGDGADTLMRKAEELRKADPSLSTYAAFEQARRENPEAQARYAAATH